MRQTLNLSFLSRVQCEKSWAVMSQRAFGNVARKNGSRERGGHRDRVLLTQRFSAPPSSLSCSLSDPCPFAWPSQHTPQALKRTHCYHGGRGNTLPRGNLDWVTALTASWVEGGRAGRRERSTVAEDAGCQSEGV